MEPSRTFLSVTLIRILMSKGSEKSLEMMTRFSREEVALLKCGVEMSSSSLALITLFRNLFLKGDE